MLILVQDKGFNIPIAGGQDKHFAQLPAGYNARPEVRGYQFFHIGSVVFEGLWSTMVIG
jgi:hypothetical protein